MSRFDLFGHPVPANLGSAGRNEHAACPEIARKIRVLLLSGWTLQRIAEQVGLSAPTLRKHYFQNGKVNRRHAVEMAAAEQRARCLLKLDEQVEAGNVGAIKQMVKVIDERERDLLREGLAGGKQEKAPKALSKGKKDQMQADAESALDQNPLFQPGYQH